MASYLIGLVLLGLVCSAAAAPQATYSTKYDSINLDEVLKNERLYKKYFNCLTGEGKCSPDAKYLKEVIPEALPTQCAKCTPRQKAGVRKVITFMMTKKPGDWARIERLYDPKGTWRKQYAAEAEGKGQKA